jgi:hypothetical protein
VTRAGVHLSEHQESQLIDELAQALEEMVDKSCPSMASLWQQGTWRARTRLGSTLPVLDFVPTRAIMQLGKSAQTKYVSLACWRHAVLWRSVLERVDEDYRRAVETMYFTPFPPDAPPYAWSRKAAAAPGIGDFESPTDLKNWAKEGCWASIEALRAECRRLIEDDGSLLAEMVKELLAPAIRKSVKDVLKLEDQWNAE